VKKEYDFSGEPSKTAFHEVVFYADCEHELKEVTGGWRVVLAFNLIWEKSRPDQMMIDANGIRDMAHYISSLKAFCRKWENAGIGVQSMIGFSLDHQYTSTNFSFAALKGEDSVIAQALLACSEDYDIYMTLRTKHVSGEPEYDYDDHYGGRRYRGYWGDYYGRRHRRGYYSDDDDDDDEDDESDDEESRENSHHEMREILDTDYEAEWIHYNGDEYEDTHSSISLDFETDVINFESEEDLFDNCSSPDDEEYEEYTGNAGPTLDYWYRRALLVIFPKKFAEDIVIRSDLVGYVQRLVENVHIRSGGTKVIFLPEAREQVRKLHPHVTRIVSSTHGGDQYRLLAVAAAMQDMTLFNRLAESICNRGTIPSFQSNIVASLSSSTKISKDWDCILYLIKSPQIGWNRVKGIINRLWTNVRRYNRRTFLNFYDLLIHYQFPHEISQYVIEELIAKDVFSESTKSYWSPAVRPPTIDDGPFIRTTYTGVDYMVDSILFLFEHNVDCGKICEEFNKLIEEMHEYNLLQRVIDKLVSVGVNALQAKHFSTDVLTMLHHFVERRLVYIQTQSRRPVSWIVPSSLISRAAPADVKQFLSSENQVFRKGGVFGGIHQARSYAAGYFDHYKQGIRCECTGTGKKAMVIVTKVSRPYAREEEDRIARFLKSSKDANLALQQAVATTTTTTLNQGSSSSSSSSSSAAAVDDNAEPGAKRFKPYSAVSLMHMVLLLFENDIFFVS
jgi:hypothetical protein